MSVAPSVQDNRGCRVLITEQELLCKNQCGFYGTPQWDGLCSQCWRTHQLEQKRTQDFNKNRTLLTKEERRLLVDPKTVVRSVIKKSPSVFSSSPLSTPPNEPVPLEFHFTRSSSPDSLEADNQLHKYIHKNFSPNHAKDLERSCNMLIEKLYKNRQSSMDDLSMIVQEFYSAISDRALRLGPTGQEFNSNDLLDHIESFLCVRAHGILFFTRSDEEAVDLSMQDWIRKLHWVTQGFLETPLDFESDTILELLNDAMAEISDMNSHKLIKDKLECLKRCSTKIFEAIKESTDRPASADEFLPVLIYVILKSNPTLLKSNINFIHRFSLNSRTCRGETGYYFTNLCCAVEFIQNLCAEKLKMPHEEFEDYTSGAKLAPIRIRSHISATKSLENSLRKMEELNEAHKELEERADQLNDSIESRFAQLHTELDKLQEAPPLVLPPELDVKALIQQELPNTPTTTSTKTADDKDESNEEEKTNNETDQ